MRRDKRKEKQEAEMELACSRADALRVLQSARSICTSRDEVISGGGLCEWLSGKIFSKRLGGGGREWRSSAAAAELKQREGKQCLSAAAPSRQRHPSPIRRTDDFTKA